MEYRQLPLDETLPHYPRTDDINGVPAPLLEPQIVCLNAPASDQKAVDRPEPETTTAPPEHKV